METTSDKPVVIPAALIKANDTIKQEYIDYCNKREELWQNPRRYFNYVDRTGTNLVTIDCIAPRFVCAKHEKAMTPEDYVLLQYVLDEFEVIRRQMNEHNLVWVKYTQQQKGFDPVDYYRDEVIAMLSKYKTSTEVVEMLKSKGYKASNDQILAFYYENKAAIETDRNEFIKNAKKFYLATDTGRMETLTMLHSRFLELFEEIHKTPKNHKRTEELKTLSAEIRQILEQARKEIKGDEIRMTVEGRIDVSASINATATILDISRKLPINIIPVYLIAAKQGILPHSIIASLVNSFYKEFNGFGNVVLGAKDTPPTTVDLIRNYNWMDIGNYQANKADSEVFISEYEEVTPEISQEAISVRDTIREMLSKPR